MSSSAKDDATTTATATSTDNNNTGQGLNAPLPLSSGTPAAANNSSNDPNAPPNGDGNGNNGLVVGPDGAIYRMVKPPIYDVENRASAEQFATAQRAFAANMNMNPMGPGAVVAQHQSLMNFNLHPGFTPFPGVNVDGTVMQPHQLQQQQLQHQQLQQQHHLHQQHLHQHQMQQHQMQQHQMQQMGLVNASDLSMSSIGPFNPVAGLPTGAQNPMLLVDDSKGVVMQPMAGMQLALSQGATGAPGAAQVAATHEVSSEATVPGTDGDGKRKASDSAAASAAAADAAAKRMRLAPNLWPSVGHLAPQSAGEQQANRFGPLSSPSSSSGARSHLLYVESDERNLSQYQCMARKQIEIFEATADDAGTNAQGRNRPVNPGQVGIRCRHCAKVPPKQRKTGAVYYPNRVSLLEAIL